MGFYSSAIKNRFRAFVISVAVRIAEARTVLLWVAHHSAVSAILSVVNIFSRSDKLIGSIAKKIVVPTSREDGSKKRRTPHEGLLNRC